MGAVVEIDVLRGVFIMMSDWYLLITPTKGCYCPNVGYEYGLQMMWIIYFGVNIAKAPIIGRLYDRVEGRGVTRERRQHFWGEEGGVGMFLVLGLCTHYPDWPCTSVRILVACWKVMACTPNQEKIRVLWCIHGAFVIFHHHTSYRLHCPPTTHQKFNMEIKHPSILESVGSISSKCSKVYRQKGGYVVFLSYCCRCHIVVDGLFAVVELLHLLRSHAYLSKGRWHQPHGLEA